MAEPPLDLSQARILISNDDGINAAGLAVLEEIARSLSPDVWVVAPETEQSAMSHSMTLRRPLQLRQVSEKRFALDGTPTDCVLVAHHNVLTDRPADLVLSGVNNGANLGEDVHYSGTVAAAMEAALLGIPAIALSQVRGDNRTMNWAPAVRHGRQAVEMITRIAWPRDMLVNVNFPSCEAEAVTGFRVCSQGRRETGIEIVEADNPFGKPYLWMGDFSDDLSEQEDSDLTAIQANAVAITPLHQDLTHRPSLERLREVIE